MTLNVDFESKAILCKAVSLIDKMVDKLKRVDALQFPTRSSEDARDLLLDAFEAIQKPATLDSVLPSVLYTNLFSLQELVESVCRSSTTSISWPLVNYCDDLWIRLFKTNAPNLFYSLTQVHNYTIVCFSDQVAKYLNGILGKPRIEELVKDRRIYCLGLPSSEDANLPLYANIGHEFGHAVFDQDSAGIFQILSQIAWPLLNAAHWTSERPDSNPNSPYFLQIIKKLGIELFCDVIGAHLMGPAFYLSLFEMFWGRNDKLAWDMSLSADESLTRAHPSPAFRLALVERWLSFKAFFSETATKVAELSPQSPKYSLSNLAVSLDQHLVDPVYVKSRCGNKDDVLEGVKQHLDELKGALSEFAAKCNVEIDRWCPDHTSLCDSAQVAKLLLRLESKILPNIEPNSLLGSRASFPAILVAAALYRLQLFAQRNIVDVSQQTDIVERLTAKAMEVTYVQQEYGKWLKGHSV
jgi:hypothetical protein